MSAAAREEYLTTEVFTATPQKLQLMLIEGAIRFGERARKHWELQQDDQANDALIRCQEIVSELLGGLTPARGTDLAKQIAGIYLFIFRCFHDAQLLRDERKLADALRVLTEERETWRQVCAKLGSTQPTADRSDGTMGHGLSFVA